MFGKPQRKLPPLPHPMPTRHFPRSPLHPCIKQQRKELGSALQAPLLSRGLSGDITQLPPTTLGCLCLKSAAGNLPSSTSRRLLGQRVEKGSAQKPTNPPARARALLRTQLAQLLLWRPESSLGTQGWAVTCPTRECGRGRLRWGSRDGLGGLPGLVPAPKHQRRP